MFPDGSTKHFTYNAKGFLSKESNERGFDTEYNYNEWNRLASVKRPDNSVITVNDSTNSTMGNNFTGGVVGQLKSYGTDADQVYDGIKDVQNVETKFVKDFNGYVTTIVDGSNQTTKIERDFKGKPVKIIRPDNTEATFVYDPTTDDLLSQADTALGITTSQTFDSFGNILTQTNGRGFTSTWNYDPVKGLLLSRADPLGHGVAYSYNALGLPLTATNALGKTTIMTYDGVGNLATIKDPLSHITAYNRDLAGNVLALTDAKNQITRYEYDLFNRLTAVVTPKIERTEYAYLPTGELQRIKDPLNNITTFEYNVLNQLTKKTDPLGFITTRSYDGNGNVAQEVDPNLNVKTFEYDNLNRLKKKILPDNVVELGYDVRGNVTEIRNNQSLIGFAYDVGGRLSSTTAQGLNAWSGLPNVTLTYTYDQNGNRKTMQDPTGLTTYQYDQADRLSQLTNPKGEVFGFGFDNANRITTSTRPGGNSAFGFDDANFITSIIHYGAGGAVLSSFAYQMDNIGNRTKMTTPAGDHDYVYDPNSQLTSATNPEASLETFSYDVISNRKTDQGGNYTYDAKSQRLNEDYRYFYTYDNNGNLISKNRKGFSGEVTNYYYSSENQLIGIKFYQPGFGSPVKEVDYAYDALGRRIEKKVVDNLNPADLTKTFTRRFIYDGQEIITEYDGNNNLLARYTHSTLRTDDVLAVDVTNTGVTAKLAQNAGSYQYGKDAQGTILDIEDNTGNKIQRYIYSAFGTILGIKDAAAADISANPKLATSYTYTGREFDSESNMFYYRARYYEPTIGRFLQKDPNPGKPDNPQLVANSYAYSVNNSINLTDPDGKVPGIPPVPVYGRWCGPSYPPNTSSSEPIDQLDAACREHDQAYKSAEENPGGAFRGYVAADLKLFTRTPDVHLDILGRLAKGDVVGAAVEYVGLHSVMTSFMFTFTPMWIAMDSMITTVSIGRALVHGEAGIRDPWTALQVMALPMFVSAGIAFEIGREARSLAKRL